MVCRPSIGACHRFSSFSCYSLQPSRRKLYRIYILVVRSFSDMTTWYTCIYICVYILPTTRPAPIVVQASVMRCNRKTIYHHTPHQSVTCVKGQPHNYISYSRWPSLQVWWAKLKDHERLRVRWWSEGLGSFLSWNDFQVRAGTWTWNHQTWHKHKLELGNQSKLSGEQP